MTIKAMQAIAEALDASGVGYDQYQRWTHLDKEGRKIVPKRECDCSSSCGTIAWLGGYPVDLSGTFYTGNIASRLKASGMDVIACGGWSQSKLYGYLRAGDFLLGPGHVVFCSTPTKWWSAENDERGRSTGGAAGDQTGREARFRAPYMRSRGWSYIIRPRSVATWQGRTLAAYSKGASITYPLGIIRKRAPYDGPLWVAFMASWAAIDKGLRLAYDPAALVVPAARHAFVALGAGLKADGTMPAKYLRRLKLAKAALDLAPASRVLVSGGAPKAGITEAALGREWLVSQGIDPSRIMIEDKSASTVGNARGSVPILAAAGITSMTLVSDASHLRRATLLFAAAQLRIETETNRLLDLDATTPLAYDDYAPKAVATAAAVSASTRSAIAAEVASLLGLSTQYKTALG